MKKYLLLLAPVLFFLVPIDKVHAQDVVSNGAKTKPINFPAGPCVYSWVNNNTSIGLAANGKGDIASFTAVNTGSSPVTATITGTPVPSPGLAYITNTGNNTLSVINLSTGATVTSIAVGEFPGAVTISADGTRVYVANNTSNSVSVIDAVKNALITTIPLASPPAFMTMSPDGSRIYVTNQLGGTVTIISTATNSVISSFTVSNGAPLGILISPDGSKAYITVASNQVLVVNTATNDLITSIPVGSDPIDLAQSPDGKLLYTSNYMDGTISVINTSTDMVVSTISCGSSPYGITISNDGGKLYVANASTSSAGSVTIINTATDAIENTISVGFDPYGIQLNPDNSLLYVEPVNGANMLAISTADNTVVSNIPVANPFSFGNFISAGVGCNGTPVTYTITVNPANTSPPTVTATTVTGTISACAGTASVSPNIQQFTASGSDLTGSITATAPPGGAFEVSLAAGSGYGGSVTIPQNSGIVSGTVVYVRSAATASAGSISGNVTLTSAGASNQTVAVTGTVNPVATPSLAIAASVNNICAGTPVTFTATATNGGSSPVYQWLLNGNNTGINSPTFASSAPTNGDVISCRLTSNATCLTIADATSNSIIMMVNAQVAPTVSINILANNVCAGTPVTFTASPSNGGSTPVYQWLLNGNNAGTNSPTFSSSTFANGDAVSCVMTSSAACAAPATANSNSIITNIFPLPVVEAGGNKTIEKGGSVGLTATASGNIADITWSPVTGLDNNKILTPHVSPASTTVYTITIQTAQGCMATDSVTVTVLYGITIPNTFTPNGDGVNDKWDIQNLKDYQNCAVRIFDRYGGEVYSSQGYYNAWDGTINGRPCPVGTYYYLINLNNGTPPLSGFVALIR